MNKMNFRKLLGGLCFLVVGATVFAGERPNILVIMTDDLRIGMLSSEGHPFMETPSLDRLAEEGVRFNNCYALSPVCGPSRASIFTGQYSTHHMRRDNFYYPETFEYYLPQSFKDSGYRTALIGKYYEGTEFQDTARKAWDRWFINKGPSRDKLTPDISHYDWWNTFLYRDQEYSIDGKTKQVMGHQTDILFDEAARFASEDENDPFCIFLSPFAPHAPFIMSERNEGKYRGKGLPDRDNQELDKGFFKDAKKAAEMPEAYEKYCEMIADLDDAMGRLLETLEEVGELDNTLIIFTSDNGLLYGEHGFAWKRHAWEESAKVPFYVRYPKLAKKGTESDALVCLADIFFTCSEVADVEFPEIKGQQGRSIVPLLTGEKEQVRDEMLFIQYEMPDRAAPWFPELMLHASLVRADGWKLTLYNEAPEQRPELASAQMFNLSRDGFEMNNKANDPESSKIFNTLRRDLKSSLEQIDADASWIE
ncbi:sulfatase-like hydrolase/transferase [Pelagicoccus mobilis]|uniref:Sulfatase-like hydrolase/transferase n=1 Tax=Pelagicoccus mobilis TaxID=415221 RepID=A0A934RXC5_9BACT|nr:sulfatase-like hydrolase/transferase [Pelagicoccus mobilis]MBK1876102.1 sulfatase-like hydrolase/transferase [Pelagicoccus mobilis]